MTSFKKLILSMIFLVLILVFSGQAANAQTFLEADSSITASQDKPWLGDYRKNLGFSFFNFSSAPMNQANELAAQVRAYNYFAFDYRLGKGRKISLRPSFEFTTHGTTVRNEYNQGRVWWGASYINYVDRRFALLPYDVDMQAEFRLYAPSPETAAQRGTIARFRPKFVFERRMTRDLSLALRVEPDYYFQSRKASLNPKGYAQGNSHYGYESGLGLEYVLNETFSLQAEVGHEQSWAHTSPENGVLEAFRKEDVVLGAGVGVALGKIFLVGGLSQAHNVAKPFRGFRPFHQEETEYYLLNNWIF